MCEPSELEKARANSRLVEAHQDTVSPRDVHRD